MEARYGQWTATTRTNPTGQKMNRPPPPGDWEFVPDIDLSDPSPEVVDGRQLPDCASFDWEDPEEYRPSQEAPKTNSEPDFWINHHAWARVALG